jgi:flagellar motor switch protein FliM
VRLLSEVLSQNEIDALLSALSSGEMDAEELKKEEKEQKVKAYDFRRALRFSKDQVRSISRVHENFARLLTTNFSTLLRTYVQIGVASVDQLPYEEFIRSVPKMTILNLFEAPPLDGNLLIEVNPNIAYTMIDRVLGGRGVGMNKIDKLTEIETRIITQLFERSLVNFKEAWSTILEIEPFFLDFEVNPQFLQMVPPNETVVVISLTTTIGETSGMINICIPHMVLEPILANLSVHQWMQRKQKIQTNGTEYQQISNQVQASELPISIELGKTTISVEEFMQLTTSDILELNQKINNPLLMLIEGKPKFEGQAGKVKNKLAYQILGEFKGEEDIYE